MCRKAQIIVVGEADEIIATAFGFLPETIDRGEERVAEVEDGFPRQSKAFGRVVAETVVSGHAERVPVEDRSGKGSIEQFGPLAQVPHRCQRNRDLCRRGAPKSGLRGRPATAIRIRALSKCYGAHFVCLTRNRKHPCAVYLTRGPAKIGPSFATKLRGTALSVSKPIARGFRKRWVNSIFCSRPGPSYRPRQEVSYPAGWLWFPIALPCRPPAARLPPGASRSV